MLNCVPLREIALLSVALCYVALCCVALHCIALHYIALHYLLWLVQPQVSLLVHYHLHVLRLVGKLPGNLIFPLVYVLGRHRVYSGYQNLLLLLPKNHRLYVCFSRSCVCF